MKLNGIERPEILFKDKGHVDLFFYGLQRCNNYDARHQAVFYCLGIDQGIREHLSDVFDFLNDTLMPEAMSCEWMSDVGKRCIWMAACLFDDMPVGMHGNDEGYSLDIFCCEYGPYFWEAIKLRYPDYCRRYIGGLTGC